MRNNRRKARIELLTLFLLFIAVGMGTIGLDGLPARVQPAPTTQSPPSGTYFDHVVFIMMENEGLQNICAGNPYPCTSYHSSTPYMSSLATNYTVAQQYTSVYRPITSQPNYVAIIGASTFGCPSSCTNINAPTLIDRFQSVGLTWKGYFENMGQSSGCVTGGSSPYNSGHNPFIAFKEFVNSGVSNATMCNNLVLANPTGCGSVTDCTLVNDLNGGSSPSFMWLTPNDCNNMHSASGCSDGCTSGGSDTCIKDGDSYLKSLVPNILNSQTFKTTRSALFITFDEGQDFCPFNGSSSEDCVFASWSGPVAKNHHVALSNELYNHYNFTRTVETNWGLPTLTTNDAKSGPMTEFFSNQPPNFTINSSPSTVNFQTGGSGNSTITLQSTGSFSGTVTLTKSSKPSAGITLTLNPSSITLTSGGTATSTLTASSSTLGTYNVTVTGTSGSLIHNATLTVNVTPPPDFQISTNPTSLTLGQTSTGASTPVLVTPTGDQTVFESSYLANAFYAKGLYWLFYEDSQVNCENMGGCLEYTTSFNGSSWTTPTNVGVHITDSVFSVYSDGSNVYYVRYNDTTFENNCGRYFQFREGTLNPSGSVTWQSEHTILHTSSTRLIANPYVILDSNGQAWVGYVIDSHGACGGNGDDKPQVVHSVGTNYASWTGFTNLTLVNSGNWHVALASLGSGQVYASYWITNIDVHGRLYNGSWQSDEQVSSTTTLADVNSWMFNSGTHVYMIYFDDLTETYNFASRSGTGTWTDYTIGLGETPTGTKFNSNYYSLPDAASYNSAANIFYLFFMNSTTHKIDEWSGSAGNWTKTTGLLTVGTVPYADSITSFITSTTQTNGALFWISGSSSPFNLNEATLTFASNSTTGTFQAIITPLYGFTGTVNLTTTISPPTGITVTCTPTTITGGSGTSTCTVTGTVGGNYTVTVEGTSGSINHSATITITVPGGGPNFTVAASTPAPANAGASTTTTITITATGGFTGIVALTDTVQSGLICGSVTPSSITGSGTATVTCHSATAGNYTLTVTGTSGSLVHSTNATFRIQDFSISATTPVTVNAGINGTTTVTIAALNGFAGTVSLTDSIPSGLLCGSITPSSITGSGTSTIACNSNTAGNYTLTITGTSVSLVHTTTVLFIVQNFTITATSPGPANTGQSAISTITVTAQNHFVGVVTLTDSIPSGLSCGPITPGSLTGSGTATVSCSATVAANYTLTITAKSGSLSQTATATFRFQDFLISVTTPITANAGSRFPTTITVTALNGFGGTVTLTDTVPSGLTCGTIAPTSMTGSGTATIACSSSVAGNYTVTVKGTSSSLVHTANAIFQIQDFTIGTTTPITVNAGSNGTTTITITSLNGFGGTIGLTDTVPSGLTCGAITPSSIVGAGTATVACSSSNAGNYTLTITGTSASLAHSITTLFIVQNFTITATSPGPANVSQSAISTITITGLNHFTGVVTITDSIPSGLSCGSITPGSVTGSGTATVSCSATLSGNYTLTLTARNGSLSHVVTATFRFQDYMISAATPISNIAGSNSNATITITSLNGFAGTVTMTDVVPSGLTCGAITPASLPGSGTATITCGSNAPGNYTLAVTGTSTSLVHSTTILFIIQDFTITATSPAAVDATQSATSTITIAALNHFAGTVSLTDSLPIGLACSTITPGTVTGSSTATVSCSSIIAGNYTLTITAKYGQLAHNATAIFRFQDYTVSVNTPAIANAGSSSTATVSIAALNHFAGTIVLNDIIPSGLTCGSITPSNIVGSGTATVTCSSTIAGNYVLTITTSSSPLSHNSTTTIGFVDFTITGSSPIVGNAKSSLPSTVTISPLNGFGSTVSLTDIIPSGLTCGTISPSNIFGGSGSATVSCNSIVAGNYTLTITGTSTSLSHNSTVNFEFQDFTISVINPGQVRVNTGGTATVTVSSINRFIGTVVLTDSLPMGITCSPISPSTITGAGSATLACSASAPGNYIVTITGTANNLTHVISTNFQIVDFSITYSPQIVSPVGNNATTLLTVTGLNGYSGNVTLSDTILTISTSSSGGGGSMRAPLKLAPPAASPTLYFNPVSIMLTNGGAGQSNVTLVLLSTVPAGNYVIQITATDGIVSHMVQLTLIATDFTVASPTGSATISPGSNSTMTLSLLSLNGFQGNVTFSSTFNPTGPNATLAPTSLILTSSGSTTLLTIQMPLTTPSGNYTLTITATSGSLARTLIMVITVPPPGHTAVMSRLFTSNDLIMLALAGIMSILAIVLVRKTVTAGRKEKILRKTVTYAGNYRERSRRQRSCFGACAPVFSPQKTLHDPRPC